VAGVEPLRESPEKLFVPRASFALPLNQLPPLLPAEPPAAVLAALPRELLLELPVPAEVLDEPPYWPEEPPGELVQDEPVPEAVFELFVLFVDPQLPPLLPPLVLPLL